MSKRRASEYWEASPIYRSVSCLENKLGFFKKLSPISLKNKQKTYGENPKKKEIWIRVS